MGWIGFMKVKQRQCILCWQVIGASSKTGICGACRERFELAYEGARDATGRVELELFALEFPACWLCGYPAKDNPQAYRIHIHHIFWGVYRKHLRSNLSRLCDWCHALAHQGILQREYVLWLKKQHDPGGYNRKELATLIGKRPPRARRPDRLLERYGSLPRRYA